MKTARAWTCVRLLTVMALAALGSCSAPAGSPRNTAAKDAAAPVVIRVLSNRADLISGGDALVEIELADSSQATGLKVDVDGRDVSDQFAVRANGRVMGLLTGLQEKSSVLTARLADGSGAHIAITNYPNGGPIFSGPQIQPWPCLDGALDLQCNRPVTYEWRYKPATAAPGSGGASTNVSNFEDYDPANPPSDVAMTTTDQGNTVPYIVRVEHGMQDRGEYRIAVLFDPASEWFPWAPQVGWNGKTYVTGGSGCGTHHGETEAPDVEVDDALARGFMVWSTALDHNTQNCNLVVQAESLMMAKERIAEAYGPIRYTIGSGCSGGSIYQQQAANDYPGIFDGILPNCSFPDSWSTAVEVTDCRFLVDYFDDPTKWAPGVIWGEQQRALVAGHPGSNICESWINVYGFDQGGNPRPVNINGLDLQSCNLTPEEAYDPESNPTGPRCSLSDYFVNQLGRRPQDGFANRPADNVGVQYGLGALLSGAITPAQFADLNVKIGSRDIDYNPVSERSAADPPSIAIAYRGGLYNMGNNMHLPIIDLRGHDIAEIHHDYRSYVMRARLDRSNGHHENQVIWVGPVALVGDVNFAHDALTVMDQWLAGIEADDSDLSYENKVALHKPAAAHDKCTNALGTEIPDPTVCTLANTTYTEPRMVAGEPFTGDVLKCQLKPLDRAGYGSVTFTDAQWAALQATFPDGVCDYTQPGVDQQMTIPWMSYAAGPGGEPLGAAPVSVPLGGGSGVGPAVSGDTRRVGGVMGIWTMLLLAAVAVRRR